MRPFDRSHRTHLVVAQYLRCWPQRKKDFSQSFSMKLIVSRTAHASIFHSQRLLVIYHIHVLCHQVQHQVNMQLKTSRVITHSELSRVIPQSYDYSCSRSSDWVFTYTKCLTYVFAQSDSLINEKMNFYLMKTTTLPVYGHTAVYIKHCAVCLIQIYTQILLRITVFSIFTINTMTNVPQKYII